MKATVTSFRTSESLFTPYNKVPYRNFAHCFSVMPILLVQFIIIPPIDYYYFLLMRLEASNFQFSVHITTENSCPWLTHSPGFFPVQKSSVPSPSLQVSELTLQPGLQEEAKATSSACMSTCFHCSLTQICCLSHTVVLPDPLLTNN